MNKNINSTKKKNIGLILAGVMICLLVFAAPVFAEGEPGAEEPPQPSVDDDSGVSEEPSDLENPSEAVAPVEADLPTEDTTVELPDENSDEPAVTIDPEGEQALPPEVLQPELPVDENVVSEAAQSGLELADENGEPLEMASNDSAEALTGADPYFFVGKTKYQFLPEGLTCPAGTEGVTCWVSEPGVNPIQDAIEYINDNGSLPTDRKIYVESGTYTGDVRIDIDTEIFSSLLNGLIGAGSGTTTIAGDVQIHYNLFGFTLSGFTINGSLTVSDSTGTLILDDLDITSPDGDGIHVHDQKGNVEIKNTRASGNDGYGAVIDYENTEGNVTIRNSSFDDNGSTLNQAAEGGLLINTPRVIRLEGISASRNQGTGNRIKWIQHPDYQERCSKWECRTL